MNLKHINDPSNKNEKYSRVIIRNFFRLNSDYKKHANQDFKLMKSNYNDYKKMIFQIFHLTNFAIHKKIIMFDSEKFLKLDQEIQAKFIEISYKFFNPDRSFLRYKKIINILNKLNIVMSKPLNLANISIRKNINSKILRSVYYQLINKFIDKNSKNNLKLKSKGYEFTLK